MTHHSTRPPPFHPLIIIDAQDAWELAWRSMDVMLYNKTLSISIGKLLNSKQKFPYDSQKLLWGQHNFLGRAP